MAENLENKDMSQITSATNSTVSYSYSYSKNEPPSRGEVLSCMQEMRNRISPEDKETFEQAIQSFTEMMGVIINLQIKLEETSYSFSYVLNSCLEIVKAIEDSGSHPEYHKRLIENHKSEWPYLWKKIEDMKIVVNQEINKSL